LLKSEALKSAISVYYSDKEGRWLESLTEGFENFLLPIREEKITNSNKIVKWFERVCRRDEEER